ncbi:GDP-mannose 4,6-dehydratase [Prochlorococcus sp. MIT 0916]|uniref:GDP-mannose 4,6-dehydratase n=1 Tax=Prochlorococcus marinus str. P0903-H212 TaxID=1622208 RepID=A0A0D5A3U1_PROMR|nr:GDP-D-mannose dehydratase [Prochlorococcus marinus str. P0903-H212]
MKTVFVLGCNGQDGTLMCKSLLEKKLKVIGLTRKSTKDLSNHVKIGIRGEVEIIHGDINNFKTILNLIEKYRPNVIYNLAAQSSVGKSFSEPIETIETIVSGTINILEACKQLSFDGSLFFAGSSEIFGNTEKPADINYKQNPLNPYSIGKQSSFNLVKMYRESNNINCVTGVLCNHESQLRSDEFVTQKIISGALKCSLNKSHKLELGNIDVARDWGWAAEYVEAMQRIANTEKPTDYVICTGKLNKLKTFIKIAFNKLDLNWENHINSNKNLYRKTDIKQNFGDPTRLKNDLDWEAKIHLEEIIEKLIEHKIKEY